MSRQSKLGDVIKKAVNARLTTVHTAVPGTILTYDSTTQKATVVIPIQFKRLIEGVATPYTAPTLPNVPVIFPQGLAGTWAFTGPLTVGDPVWLMFAERSTDEYLSVGGSGVVPQSTRRFHISDAFCIPGAAPTPNALPALAVDPAEPVLYSATGVKLGSSAAANPVAKSVENDQNWAALANVFTAWTPPVLPDSGAALKVLLTALIALGWPTATASTKVKVDT